MSGEFEGTFFFSIDGTRYERTGRTEIKEGEISGKAIWRGGTGKFAQINGPLTYMGKVNPSGQGSAKIEGHS